MTQRVPDLLIEKMLAGELGERERKSVIDRLMAEEGGMKRLEDAKNSNMEILEKYKPAEMAEAIKRRYRAYTPVMEKQAKPGLLDMLRKHRAAFSFAATSLLVVMIALPLAWNLIAGGDDQTRIKGDAGLFLFRKTKTGQEALKDGATAKKGDIIQIAYMAGKEKYGVIFSVDGKNNLTWHYPYSMQGEAMVTQGRKTALVEGYELDNAPKYEKFFFVLSGSRIDVRLAVEKANQFAESGDVNGASNYFRGLRIVTFTLKKEER